MRLASSCFGAAVVVASFALAGDAEQCRVPTEIQPVAHNLDFAESALGTAPAKWFLGPEWFMAPHAPVYEAKIVSVEQCNGGLQCTALQSLRDDSSVRLSFLYQVLDATQYRGKVLTYRADVRANVNLGSAARLLVRVHRPDCSTSFLDNMGGRPITAGEWSPYEIRAPIALDARDIEFGVQLVGQGAAWIDKVSMTFADTAR